MYDRLTPGMLARLAGVDRLDAGVGVGAAEHLGVQHAGELHVVGVDGLAGDLAGALDAGDGLADVAVLALGSSSRVLRLLCHRSYLSSERHLLVRAAMTAS